MIKVLLLIFCLVNMLGTAEARYYSPDTGRFLSSDPIGFKGGDAVQDNYVTNNPVNLRDPSGLIGEQYAPVVEEEVTVLVERYGPRFVEWVQRLMNRYPASSLKCDKLANGVYKAFQKVGAKPQIIEITDSQGARFFFTDGGMKFAESGFHRAVRVGDRIYDALTGINGLTSAEYTNKLLYYGLYPSIKAVK